MDTAVQTFEPTPEPVPRPSANAPQLRTLLLTDLADSTGLIERLGDVPASDLFRAHDRLVLQLQQQWRGRLIDRSDGLLLLFERPIDGLGFALDYMRGLTALGAERDLELRARAGLHVGEVLTWRNSAEAVSVGAKPLEVEGLAKPMAARLMAMARPGQILLSAVAEPLAHRAARELGERGQHLVWKSWGRWRFKGVPEVQEIFEVGEPGLAPIRVPPSTPKAWRDVPLWRRPAALAAEFAVLALGVLGLWFLTRPEPAIAFNQRDWVVVGDLRNLTGQSALDDSLEQAFRISLEQSRYVNVLSDLKARDTLQRMQRPADTVLDRAVASEIALRDGARAVILPTVAEVGGRVRVSAEVIDPRTQTTVYTESAEGSGIGSTLDSIDDVTAALRGKLGEAVKSIEKDSVPLPQVTTKNLDALRAYALGLRAYAKGSMAEALQHFAQATALDPQFALAYVGSARVLMSQAETARALPFFAQAAELKHHLPPRDALYLDAWAAEFAKGAATKATEKWQTLAGLYPDHYGALFNYSWRLFNLGRYEESLKYARAATDSHNPTRGYAIDQIGRVQMALGRYGDALKSFRLADKTRGVRASRQTAAALATLRDFQAARNALAQIPADNLSASLERITVSVDQGQLDEALHHAEAARLAAAGRNLTLESIFSAVEFSVRILRDPKASTERDVDELIGKSIKSVDDATSADASDRLFVASAVAYLAQRNGHDETVKRQLPDLVKLARKIEDPRIDQMIDLIRADQQRMSGDTSGALSRLRALVDGSELFQVHVALRDALDAAGHRDEALREDRWLADHRGLAYAEPTGGQVLQATNVASIAAAQVTKIPAE